MGKTVVILGAGLAGSSVAWALTRAGQGEAPNVVVLEREAAAATHASAQNAAMVRSLVFESAISPFALRGTRFWNELPAELDGAGMFRRTGSLLLASEPATVARLQSAVERARAYGLAPEMWTRGQCRERFGLLRDTPILAAAYSPDDGVADPVALVDRLLTRARARGAELQLGAEVARMMVERRVVRGVELAGGRLVEADSLVLAAGAWAGPLRRAAGLDDHGLKAHRRHLFSSVDASVLSGLRPDDPFVWHLDLQAYFRPEGSGVLFCACDEEVVAPCRPEVATGIEQLAEQRFRTVFPFLSDLAIQRTWAGLRTFTPDTSFVLGRDPQTQGLFDAIGLGGHGVTCAIPAGEQVAAAIQGKGEARCRSRFFL